MKNLFLTFCLGIATLFGSVGMGFAVSKCISSAEVWDNCFGTHIDASGKYMGEWSRNKHSGQGILEYANGDKYAGQWRDGNYHGEGTFTFLDGEQYVGEWKNGKRNGGGTYTLIDGTVKQGLWKDDDFLSPSMVPSLVDNKTKNLENVCVSANKDIYQVSDVLSNDVLNIRSGPSASYAKIGAFSYDEKDVLALGETHVRNTECEKFCELLAAGKLSDLTNITNRCVKKNKIWFRVQSGSDLQGWVSSKYLKKASNNRELISGIDFLTVVLDTDLGKKLHQQGMPSSSCEMLLSQFKNSIKDEEIMTLEFEVPKISGSVIEMYCVKSDGSVRSKDN